MNVRRIIFIILSCIWMTVIFCFSARDADESEKDSYKVGLTVGKVIVHDFEKQSEEKQMEFAKKVDHPIRKMAHATEYAILGMLLIGVFYPVKKYYLIAFLVSVVYSVTDEVHQLFVPGRSGQPTDVMIDSLGALIGILLILAFISLTKRRKVLVSSDTVK